MLGLLGLARRAGAVVKGTDATRRALRDGDVALVWLAEDASAVQLEKIRKAMADRAIPQVILGDRDTLGAAVGSSPLSALAVTDGSFAARLLEELSVEGDGEGASEAQGQHAGF